MPSLDGLIKETLYSRVEQIKMPEGNWSEVSKHLPGEKKWARQFKTPTSIAACLILALAVFSGTEFFRHKSLSSPIQARAQAPVQLYGTIQSIRSGNPSRATLVNVSDIEIPNTPPKHFDSKTITLPEGKWVAPGHWQSIGDTMDLFVGENITDLEHGKHITGYVDIGFQAGIIKTVSNNELTVYKILLSSSGSRTSSQTATIHLKPYTRVSSWNGSVHAVSDLKPGLRVNLAMEGTKSYLIASQVTVAATN